MSPLPAPQVQSITSRDNPLVLKLRKLVADAAAYRKFGEVWVEGDHLCSAALARGVQPLLAVVADSAWNGEGGLADLSDPAGLLHSRLARQARKVAVVPDALWKVFSGLESPARVGFLLQTGSGEGLRAGCHTLVLDRLQDAGNVGTLIRSASALGVQQVVALKGTAALWSPKVLRAGMGAHWALHLVEQATVDDLGALGVPLVATSSHAAHGLHEAPLAWPCAWVLGHEGQGVSEALMARCAMVVRIPQPGGEESLNVGVAGAICLYESLRRCL